MNTIIRPTKLAGQVLRASEDGNRLDLIDLRYVEYAANGALNEEGIQYLQEVKNRLEAGAYRRRWLHGIPNLTADLDGFVLWREQHVVEHYVHPYDPANAEALLELARRCRHVESLGLEPVTSRVVNGWGWLRTVTREHPYFDLVAHGFYEILVRGEECLISFGMIGDHELVATVADGNVRWDKGPAGQYPYEGTRLRRRQGWQAPAGENRIHYDLQALTSLLRSFKVPYGLSPTMD